MHGLASNTCGEHCSRVQLRFTYESDKLKMIFLVQTYSTNQLAPVDLLTLERIAEIWWRESMNKNWSTLPSMQTFVGQSHVPI